MEPKYLNHRPPPYLPELHSQWNEKLRQLRADELNAKQLIETLQEDSPDNKANSAQIHQAQIHRHQIAQAYMSHPG